MLPMLVLPPTESETPTVIKAPKRLRLPVFALKAIEEKNIPTKKVAAVVVKKPKTVDLSTRRLNTKNIYREYKDVQEFLNSLVTASRSLKKSELSYFKRYIGLSLQDIQNLETDMGKNRGKCLILCKSLMKTVQSIIPVCL